MLEKIKRVLCAIGIFASGMIAGIIAVVLLRHENMNRDGGNTPQKKKDEVHHEIENTPASALVDSAPNSDALRSEHRQIASGAKQRLRDRSREIIRGNAGAGTPAGSGSGD